MHKGKIIAEKEKFKVIDCEVYGFKHLYPVPSEKVLDSFYKMKFVSHIKKTGSTPDMKRILSNGEKKKKELKWLTSTLYKDVNYYLKKFVNKNSKTLCDIGCCTGNFLKYMSSKKWKVIGIEPSKECFEITKQLKLNIFCGNLEEFLIENPNYKNSFDVVSMINVLEHVRNPIKTLKQAKNLLKPKKGIICIRVPNEFNKLQIYAEKKVNKKFWYIAIPEHINYFDCQSLKKLLESHNFEILYFTTDFPMKFFLLFGENYVDNPEIGNICHKKSINFELSISDELRRNIYHNFS
jgi:2-polyprenyl-3-methyl-5-hydroxy-6-metoxy-1,4-benzoquinol methylase